MGVLAFLKAVNIQMLNQLGSKLIMNNDATFHI